MAKESTGKDWADQTVEEKLEELKLTIEIILHGSNKFMEAFISYLESGAETKQKRAFFDSYLCEEENKKN